jgi:hypothetical protein
MLNKSFQAQFLIPMAISVAFGLLFVTVIILILLPIYLKWINTLHRSWIWVSNGRWLSSRDAEPAIREMHLNTELASESSTSNDSIEK